MKPAVFLAVLALVACSGGEPAAGGADDAAAPADIVVPAAAPPAPARLASLPGPAVGRWSYNETQDGQPTPRKDQCIFDTVTMNEAYLLFRPHSPQCPPPTFRQEGASILGSYACENDRTEITITGNLASAYTLTEVMTSGSPPATTTFITIATRTGECSGQPEPPLLPDPPAEPPAQ